MINNCITYTQFIKSNYLEDKDLLEFRKFAIISVIKNRGTQFLRTSRTPADFVLGFYTWSSTPQHHQHWSKIHQDFQKYNYTKKQ